MKDYQSLQGIKWFSHDKSWVLLYFSTTWCAPCKSMVPIMNDISTRYSDQIKTIKIDVDEQMKLAEQFNVKGVPTLVLLDKDGTQRSLVGGVSTPQIIDWLNNELNQEPEQ